MMYITIIIIIILILEKIIENAQNTEKKEEIIQNNYEKKEYLLTKNELKFYKILKEITNNLNLELFCQVSLYQIIKSKSYKEFNKIKSKSIDFVITEKNCKILLCIELDDKTHEQKKRIDRDNFINKIFEDNKIKLLRIKTQEYYNKEEIQEKIKNKIN